MFYCAVATTIPTRALPDTVLALSKLSLGCAQLGNMYREVSDADARRTQGFVVTGHPPTSLGF